MTGRRKRRKEERGNVKKQRRKWGVRKGEKDERKQKRKKRKDRQGAKEEKWEQRKSQYERRYKKSHHSLRMFTASPHILTCNHGICFRIGCLHIAAVTTETPAYLFQTHGQCYTEDAFHFISFKWNSSALSWQGFGPERGAMISFCVLESVEFSDVEMVWEGLMLGLG